MMIDDLVTIQTSPIGTFSPPSLPIALAAWLLLWLTCKHLVFPIDMLTAWTNGRRNREKLPATVYSLVLFDSESNTEWGYEVGSRQQSIVRYSLCPRNGNFRSSWAPWAVSGRKQEPQVNFDYLRTFFVRVLVLSVLGAAAYYTS